MITQDRKDRFPPLVVEIVQLCKHLFNVPEEMSLPIILATINFPAQALTNVNPILWKSSPLSLYCTVLSDTGSQKSTVMGEVTTAIELFQADKYKQYKKDMVDYSIARKKFEKEITIAATPSKSDQEHELQYETPVEPEAPLSGMLLVQKATLNGIIDTLAVSPLAGLFNPDAAEFFNSHAFQTKETGIEMIASLAKLYSGEAIQRQTGVKETNMRIEKRRFSMLCLMQQQMAGFLLNSKYNDQGFVPRMLVAQPAVTAPPVHDFSPDARQQRQQWNDQMEPFHARVLSLLHKAFDQHQKRLNQAKQLDPNGYVSNKELVLPLMQFDNNCNDVLCDFANKMTQLTQDPTMVKHVGYLRRAYDNACRIAATFAVFDGLNTIPIKYALGAIATVEWFTAQRLNLEIDREVAVSQTVEVGRDLYEWIKKTVNETKEPVSQTMLMQKAPRAYRLKTKVERTAILDELVSRDMVKIIETAAPNRKIARAVDIV